MNKVIECWKFRWEAPCDLIWLCEGQTDWEKIGLKLEDVRFDMENMEIVVSAETTEAIDEGMHRLAKRINKVPDSHVIIESFKLKRFYDTERNGPLSDHVG